MKSLSLLQLLLCISSIAGTYNYEHLKEAKTGSEELAHSSHKRQVSPFLDSACNIALLTSQCTSGYSEEAASLCGESTSDQEAAIIQQGNCQSNSMGTICGAYVIANSSECRDILIDARDELGCCLKAVNNSGSFSYSLWSLCGVEPVIQDCSSSAFELPAQDLSNPACTEFDPELAICREGYMETLQTALRAEGCQDQADDLDSTW